VKEKTGQTEEKTNGKDIEEGEGEGEGEKEEI
jgi:hypothetical protein